MTVLVNARRVFTVTQVNRYVKKLMEADALLAGIFIEGELSNFKPHSSGHMYFTLKDATGSISGVMFGSYAEHVKFTPASGMKVVAFGRLSLYEKTGQYQVYVEYLEPAGLGGMQLALEELKKKLESEGLLRQERKKTIPIFAKTVAVITSPTGAAVRDIIKVVRDKNPTIKLVVAPAYVQGEGAARDLARALEEVNEWGEADVIIIGRGGGAAEDLWAFNEEVLVRAIAKSKIPVISAVGHETDVTLSDFVADMRAPTPTAAAQLAVYDLFDASHAVFALMESINSGVKTKILSSHREVASLNEGISKSIERKLGNINLNLARLETWLEKVSPFAAFKRGYAFVRDEGGNPIAEAKDVEKGQKLELHWADGKVNVVVT